MSLETITKYGIKTNANAVVLAIDFFNNTPVPKDYFEITEQQYFQFIEVVTPYSTFNGQVLTNDPQDAADYLNAQNIASLRNQLRDKSIAIDLATRMGESTTALVADFDVLKRQYENLTNP